MPTSAELYLDLLTKCLTRYLFIDEEVRDVLTPDDPWNHNHAWSEGPDWKHRVWSPVQRALASRGVRVVTRVWRRLPIRVGGGLLRRAAEAGPV